MIAYGAQRAETSASLTSFPLPNMRRSISHQRGDETNATDIAFNGPIERSFDCSDELDTMVLSLLAIEAYLDRYTPQ